MRRNTTNEKVRKCLDQHDMRQWQLADIFHVYENTLSRWLRYELPDNIQDLFCEVIKGNTQHTGKIKEYFHLTAMSTDDDILGKSIETVIKEVSEREFEADLEREREREQWLYEERKKRNEY